MFFLTLFFAEGNVWAKNNVVAVRVGVQPANVSRFVLEVTEKPEFDVGYLDNPRRFYLDVKNLDFTKVKMESVRAGAITGVSIGTSGNVIKFSLEVSNPVRVKKSFVLNPVSSAGNYRLVVDLESVSETEFAKLVSDKSNTNAGNDNAKGGVVAATKSDASKTTVNTVSTQSKTVTKTVISKTTTVNRGNSGKVQDDKKIIVIDAGHGGKDPGTIGVNGTYEKTIALAFARQLRDILVKNSSYKVILTREGDTFIPLQDRAKVAERNNAALFVSIHLNSSSNKQTNGFSIYTLSEQATDDEARKIAEKENAADLLGIGSFEGYDAVTKNILGDLLQTQVKIASVEFANEVVSQVKQDVPCIYHPHREAPFVVLRSSIPSVLMEVGFLSNKDEEKKLNQKWYREKLSYSFARAIDNVLKN